LGASRLAWRLRTNAPKEVSARLSSHKEKDLAGDEAQHRTPPTRHPQVLRKTASILRTYTSQMAHAAHCRGVNVPRGSSPQRHGHKSLYGTTGYLLTGVKNCRETFPSSAEQLRKSKF
jgi:hypothetical protein